MVLGPKKTFFSFLEYQGSGPHAQDAPFWVSVHGASCPDLALEVAYNLGAQVSARLTAGTGCAAEEQAAFATPPPRT